MVNHNSIHKTAWRVEPAAGFCYSDKYGMPLFDASVGAVIPLSDPNAVRGFKFSARSTYSFPHSFMGITAGGTIYVVSFIEGTKRNGLQPVSSVFIGMTINLSAIAGQ